MSLKIITDIFLDFDKIKERHMNILLFSVIKYEYFYP